MRAIGIDSKLNKYADTITEHDKRAKELLDSVGMPPQYYEQQANKKKALEVCQTLKQQRQRHKLTQADLAAKVGMKKEFISRIESGKVDVQLSTFLKILDGLNLKMLVQ